MLCVRVCLKNRNWAAARDFGCAPGEPFRAPVHRSLGEGGSPKRAVRKGSTPRTGKSAAAGQFPFFRQALTEKRALFPTRVIIEPKLKTVK